MSKTVVGLFNTTAQAHQVKEALVSQGYDSSDISIVADGSTEDEGIGHRISHFFSSLTGGDDAGNDFYARGVKQGGTLLRVDTDADDAEKVSSILQQHGARMDDGAYDARGTASVGGEVIPVVEEQLVVGKREVDRGGVRVFSRIVEDPVSADVTLRDEYINVERKAVDRPATEADFQTGTAAFELRASGEEAVVGKTSRVVEEIVVGKEASRHTEVIHDSVRRTEVDVEELETAGATTGTLAGVATDKDRF